MDVPGVVGDPLIRARDVPEFEQQERFGEERRAERNDDAGEVRRATAETTATTASTDESTAATRTATSVATASGRSSASRKVTSPPITANTPWAKLTIPVVR